ncbi:MAG: hypothetical protein ACREV2_16995 [Burkholderiales bacterium]
MLLWLCTLLFAARVAGQALQFVLPQPWLPRFDAFQGSKLPYWALFSAQLAILALMLRVSYRAGSGKLRANPRLGKALTWAGSVYFAGSILRIVVGLAVSEAPEWFRAWMPASLHVVLASFVLVLAACYRGDRGEVE